MSYNKFSSLSNKRDSGSTTHDSTSNNGRRKKGEKRINTSRYVLTMLGGKIKRSFATLQERDFVSWQIAGMRFKTAIEFSAFLRNAKTYEEVEV